LSIVAGVVRRGIRLPPVGYRWTAIFGLFRRRGRPQLRPQSSRLKAALLDYLTADRVVHSLDMSTVAKAAFLERFNEVILRPRRLDYKVQFPGPTGTNSVESALKLARKVTGRESVISFTNGSTG
jgi:glutamate-1-semialdehyde aminotransferase